MTEKNQPAWHQEWLDTQGFIHNDDDLISDPTDEPELDYCPECSGSGDKFTDFWGEGKGRLQPCKRCGGKGYVWQ